MISLAYFSTAADVPDPAELEAILKVSRRNNTAAGVTGLLCHLDGSFLQFLEGEEAPVRATFERIALDPRHHDILKVHDTVIAVRAFGDWSMGLVNARDVDAAHQAFCHNLREVEIAATVDQRTALEGLLKTFRAWMR